MQRDAHPQSLPFITFRALSKGAPPPGSPNRALIERDAPFPVPFQLSLRVPGEWTPHEEGCLSPEPSQGPVDEPPTKFPKGATMENDVHPLSPPPHILPDPQE